MILTCLFHSQMKYSRPSVYLIIKFQNSGQAVLYYGRKLNSKNKKENEELLLIIYIRVIVSYVCNLSKIHSLYYPVQFRSFSSGKHALLRFSRDVELILKVCVPFFAELVVGWEKLIFFMLVGIRVSCKLSTSFRFRFFRAYWNNF